MFVFYRVPIDDENGIATKQVELVVDSRRILGIVPTIGSEDGMYSLTELNNAVKDLAATMEDVPPITSNEALLDYQNS